MFFLSPLSPGAPHGATRVLSNNLPNYKMSAPAGFRRMPHPFRHFESYGRNVSMTLFIHLPNKSVSIESAF